MLVRVLILGLRSLREWGVGNREWADKGDKGDEEDREKGKQAKNN